MTAEPDWRSLAERLLKEYERMILVHDDKDRSLIAEARKMLLENPS